MTSTETVAGIDSDAFRHVVGHLTSGVTVITGKIDRTRFGMTASSVTSLSLDPPMMLACVNRQSPTAEAILRARHYTINVLGAGQESLARQFAVPSADKFRGVRLGQGQLGGPVLADALACIECELVDSVYGGTHAVFIGRVVHAMARVGDPLAYYRGGFGLFQHVDDDAAYRAIRGMILSNRWGRRPRQDDEVASMLGVDSSVAFHALNRLSADGMVAWEPDIGYIVTNLDPRLIEAAAEARCVMELGVVAVALPDASSEEIREVRAKFEAMSPLLVRDELVDVERFFAAHTAFHRAIMALSHNSTLVESFEKLDLQQLMIRGMNGSRKSSDAFLRIQAELTDALEGRDVTGARDAIVRYTEMVRQRVRSSSLETTDR